MLEVTVVLIGLGVAGGYWAWHAWRGEAVGVAKGVMQGEFSVPGAPVTAVVRRHLSGGRPDEAEIQLWTWGVTKAFTLQPGDAIALAQALERAAAEIRGEE